MTRAMPSKMGERRRRLGIRKCGIEPQESTRIFSSISPPKKPESAYFIALCSHL